MTTIHIEGVDELIKRLDTIEGMGRVKGAIFAAGIYLEKKLKEYPTESHRPNPLIKLDPKVRRGFFYHLNHGDIDVPYRRTKRLYNDWTTQKENSGWRVVVGNSMSYARLVQDSAKQTSYHRGTGWITTKQTVQLYGNQAVDQVRNALRQEVQHG